MPCSVHQLLVVNVENPSICQISDLCALEIWLEEWYNFWRLLLDREEATLTQLPC